jgi:hypothetical protein
MRGLLSLVALVAACAVPAAAQEKPKPEPAKPEAKAAEAPALAGRWAMSVDTPQGSRQVTMTLALEGKKLTGTLSSEMGDAPIAGEFADNKLSFSISMQTGNGDMQIGFSGAFKEDGSLAGTMDFGQGAMNWTAQKIKEKL